MTSFDTFFNSYYIHLELFSDNKIAINALSIETYEFYSSEFDNEIFDSLYIPCTKFFNIFVKGLSGHADVKTHLTFDSDGNLEIAIDVDNDWCIIDKGYVLLKNTDLKRHNNILKKVVAKIKNR